MASSSQIPCAYPPPSDPCWRYDVFLSFRGVDTRKGITIDIYDGLNRRGIKTFMDDPDLKVGDTISRTLIEAIEGSRFAIVVLSQNYASSTWCLEELREICLSMEDNRIFPLFYHVEPTDVRYQKQSFEEAFSKHESSGRYESEKVNHWKAALNKVANISGWNTQNYKTHKELVNAIVDVLISRAVPEAIESTADFQAFEATRVAMDEVMKALKDDEVTAVGVYGMGGVGKTTLVEHVGAQARKSGSFDYVTKCVVSQNPGFEILQDALAEQLGFKLHEETEIGRSTRLHKEIMRRTKILIILDDIWEGMKLSRVGIPSHKELQKCNSKILLTTRIRNVCHAMECQRKITLNILSEQDSWALFVSKVRRSFESSTFEGVAKKVAGECRGLPIALVTVARALGDKELVEWEIAALRLKKSRTANPDDYGEATKCIKLSYDYLKNEDYKSYFLLCCLFPEDYGIPIKDLFRYGIRTRLFRDAETLLEARKQVDSVVKHLKYSCLLLDSKTDGFVRMHEVVRDAAIQIVLSEDEFFVKAGCRLEDWPRNLHKGYLAISLMRNYIRELPKNLVCPKLQILLLNHNIFLEHIPETFFQCPNELRVLDLSWTTSLSLLPKSLGLLTNLTALYLDNCDHLSIDTSILGKLKKLEMLSMRNSRLYELSVEIGGLTNLRMLDITGEHISRIPSKLLSKLHNLEELYMQGFWEWERLEPNAEGEEGEVNDTFTNASFDEVTSLSKLRVLKVTIRGVEHIPKYVEQKMNLVEFDICIGGLYEPYKTKLYDRHRHISILLDVMISHLPEWFRDEIMKKAETFSDSWCHRLIDIFVESEHGRLQRLKHLHIVGYSSRDITEVDPAITWVPRKPVFENLEELYMEGLDCAELRAVQFLPCGSLFKLKVLKVEYCYNWWNILLPSTLLHRLPNLEVLIVCQTDGSEYMFGYEALLVLQQLKLKKIELFALATVSICEGPAPPAMLQNLQSLSITKCKLEGSLFTSDVAQCLFQLNSLELAVCPLLERIVEASNKKIILPKLEQLSLTELPMLYKSATFDIECPSLENMSLKGCWFPWEQWRLRKIALSTVSICDGPSRLPPAMFQNLQSLSIEWCKSDGSLFTYDVAQCLSQLNSLKFKNCPLLERIVEASNKKTVLPKLKRLHLEVLPMLYYESDTFDIVCPELEEFFVSSCPKFSASSSDFHSRKQVQFIWRPS
uniref:probable disease resistance protein At4g27220 isoform X2 n=1 Tax=Fragaria vesca subsp. vesca TaxID=101020 RepID=UPI0005CAE602|nr:PREDICTED: probable disease resistance protein At4g27220 isoform X2 [Fragaria vesca subsp. vesca]